MTVRFGHADNMTEIFNKHSEKSKRKRLRHRMTKAETILWSRLRRRQVAGIKFRRQYGVYRFVLDFYCPELKLAIEVDGPIHDSLEAQAYDKMRQEIIEKLGIEFLRFRNAEVYENLDAVIGRIYEKILVLQQRYQ